MTISKAKRRRLKLKAHRAPRSAAHPRPGNRPYYIEPNCPDCGIPLVLEDVLANPDCPEDEIWHDEWTCPSCRNGAYLDWPAEQWQAVEERAKLFKGLTIAVPEDKSGMLKKIISKDPSAVPRLRGD